MTNANSFLEIVKRERANCHYSGDRYGGPSGSAGRGLPKGHNSEFAFATGIECSYPTIVGSDGRPLRRDQLEEFGNITTLAHGEMFELTARPAQLKVEV